MNLIKLSIFSAVAALALIISGQASAQTEVTYIDPLFEYPVAPDNLTTLESKSIYLLEHFWDPMDFKSKKSVDQNALNDAFKVYCVPMQYAPKDAVDKSVDKLISRISKNHVLLLQMTKAAEENLYGPRTSVWIDEVYIRFLEALMKDKKISDIRKLRYSNQLKQLKATLVGHKAPEFDFRDANGLPKRYFPMRTFTVIEFGDPECDDCRHSLLKLDSNAKLSRLIKEGKVNILFIIPDAFEGWETSLSGYPKGWTVGAGEDLDEILDLRTVPSFYIIGSDGNIIAKNVDVNTVIREIEKTFE